MDSEWVKVYTSTLAHKVDLMKLILEENGLEAVILNQQDSFYKTIGEISLMVKGENVILAKKIISEAAL